MTLGAISPRAKLDLHIHTSLSDGAHSPDKTLELAAKGGLDIVALTDHDLVAPVQHGPRVVAGRQLWVLAAAELTGVHNGVEYHLLVYFPGPMPAAFGQLCESQCAERIGRYQQAVLNIGLDVPANPPRGVRAPTRLHLARALVNAKHASSVSDAFGRYLGRSLGKVPLLSISFQEAIAAARSCGGLTSWAHPSPTAIQRHLPAFISAGLQGLEGIRPTTSRKARNVIKRAAKRHSLFITGGSDWHGLPGTELGLFSVQAQQVQGFLQALSTCKRLPPARKEPTVPPSLTPRSAP